MNSRRFTRPQPQLPLKPRVVIACEGQVTEYRYFSQLKLANRLATVRVLQQPKSDPLSVVEALIRFTRHEARQGGWRDNDAAWAVFDGDEHRATEGLGKRWERAIELAGERGINLAISNPCFEFFCRLHFEECYQHHSAADAKRWLRQQMPNYERRPDRIFADLRPNTAQAIDRARRVAKQACDKGLHPHDNPCCDGVATLVEMLLGLK